MTSTSRTLSPSTLDLSLRGRNLRGSTLADNLAGEPTLLAFLRQLG